MIIIIFLEYKKFSIKKKLSVSKIQKFLSTVKKKIKIKKKIIIIIIILSISSKRLFSLIYKVKYLKLSFPKIPLKNAVSLLI